MAEKKKKYASKKTKTSLKSKPVKKKELPKKLHSKVDHIKKSEHLKPHKKEVSNKKDIIVIAILSVLIIAIIVISFLSSSENDLSSTIDSNINNNITNFNDSNNIQEKQTMSVEEFQEKSLNLQLEIFDKIREKQIDVLKPHYKDLNLDQTQMNVCLENNDYTSKDINLVDANIVYKIQEDTLLASAIGVDGTPGMYINSYLITGAKDYNLIDDVINLALQEPKLDLNYDNRTYQSDTNQNAKLNIIYNDSQMMKESYNDFENYITTSDQLTPTIKEFFISLFDETEINYVDYRSENAKKYLETLNIEQIPAWYLEGDISELEVTRDSNFSKLFDQLFVETSFGGYILNQQFMYQLINATNIEPLYQFINYGEFNIDKDYIIGNKDANVTFYLFSDYSCPYCKLFIDNTLPKIIENYVDTNKVNLVIKDYIVNETSSLFLAVFSRCAEQQGSYLETFYKLFELSDQLGESAVVEPVFTEYEDEINEINKLYQEVMSNK